MMLPSLIVAQAPHRFSKPVTEKTPTVWITSDTYKISPKNGNAMEGLLHAYWGEPLDRIRTKNHIWDSEKNEIRLSGARKEIISFQIVLPNVEKAELSFDAASEPDMVRAIEVFWEWNVSIDGVFIPDALVPAAGSKGWFPLSFSEDSMKERAVRVLWVDITIPEQTDPGDHVLPFTLTFGATKHTMKVLLTVYPFTIPDASSLIAECNSYGGIETAVPGMQAGTPEYWDFVRKVFILAHDHRGTLNILPYSQSGKWVHDIFIDTARYDAYMGPFLSGKAFEKTLRGPVPLTHQYLPINLTWPGDWTLYKTNKAAYEQQVKEGAQRLLRHLKAKGYNKTEWHLFMNNKKKWNICPWDMDEPMDRADYDGLAWFGHLFDAIKKMGPKIMVKPVYRIDIYKFWPSQISDINKILGPVTDLWNVELGSWEKEALLRYKKDGKKLWMYMPTKGEINMPLTDMRDWAWKSYQLKCDGFCFWSTTSMAPGRWEKPHAENRGSDQLFYSGAPFGKNEPWPSLRLKALRRGMYDHEYFTLLEEKQGRKAVENILEKWYFPGNTNWWETPERWDAVRAEVARAIAQTMEKTKK
ncbi:MAG: hypothetical protein A2268_00130 [Candidatus Raymondbacteria bacterium RifOxyA12_full_50_37]|uniref:Uncharacterized protein n=1 Tax=Candidatus Raymondbacteria bacterium RIFOXYD12_FULL_49_13 TaxID=1817890 RepID=A0A1F7F279_UNCRA|nr:MAG: hypothetical protein A2268_00130 [Candidatus Raymondbacteria bacterium RifOxyA12_full_50_37]OGJ92727.1 MAG: hypothetical protein A2248_04180 [Candidatus Raymondbacteria bacterium RIFOXYA2_FULL_49_16]OGJ95922.1 MAG: hypothetical protein A2487_04495 [Candidatus Raymondbacteria bacterium RifOxyC12_full_50_8]OGK00741.1 MAG: hypothetical protein A2519_19940 [Candidatus Raymondbacteria bacterium RIFOXYD12_FULL_49_13]OGK04194.1 MAG: hypothetical protein A2350_02725 [Candidatus Raymondbacteria 